MKKRVCLNLIVSLLLLQCLLPLTGLAGNGGAADSSALAYDIAISMLKSASLTDGQKLQDIRSYLERAGSYKFSIQYLMLVDGLLVMKGDDAFAYDEALSKINLISRDERFLVDYNAIDENSDMQIPPDLESLNKYIQARKMQAFGDKQGAIQLYEQYPVLDSLMRADSLLSEGKREQYEQGISLIQEGALATFHEAAIIFELLGDYRDSLVKLAECRALIAQLATPVPTTTPVLALQPPATLSVSFSSGVITLRWAPISGVQRYRVYRGLSPDGFEILTGTQSTEYIDTSVYAGQTYYYRVSYFIGGIESDSTATAVAAVPGVVPTSTPWPPQVGQIITLGKYEQDNDLTNGKEAILWRVLAVEKNRILLISEFCLESNPYHAKSWEEGVTWETCTLRNWLNNEFLNAAFIVAEREAILKTKVKNYKNPIYETDGGRDTSDRIFLLSTSEAGKYFRNDIDRQAKLTPYVKSKGVFSTFYDTCWWWLRSPGNTKYSASYVSINGSIHLEGCTAGIITYCAVRPALWFDFNAENF